MTSVAGVANRTTFRNLNLVTSAQQILLNYPRIRTGYQGSQCFVTHGILHVGQCVFIYASLFLIK